MAFYNRADIKQQTEGEKSKRFNRSFWGIAKQAAELQPKIAGDVAKTLYEGATSAVDRVGKGYGEVINEATGGAQKSRNEQSAAQKEDTETIRQLGEKLKKATTDEDKNRYSKAIQAITGIGDEQDAAFQERQAQVAEATDPVKAAAAVGSIGLDVLTAGAGGAVIKGARAAERASEAARVPGAAERAVNTIVNPQGGAQAAKSGAVLGAGYGGLGAVQEEGANVTPLDIAGNATVGAVAGAGIGGLLGSLSGALAKSRGRDVTPMDDIKVAELPFFQASQRLTPEQQTRLKQVLDNDPAMATRALSMTDDEAVKLTDAIIKGPEVTTPKQPASVSENIVPTQEVSANPFQAPERPIVDSNTITPGQNPINDLEAAAVSDNPAEYLRSRDAAQIVTPEAPVISADVPASFAPVDAPTQAKVEALKAESDQTPLQEGLTRLYQTNDNTDQASTNYFQDPDRLSNWINGRDDNAELSFVDVPSETVVPLERKPGVFKVAEPTPQNRASDIISGTKQDATVVPEELNDIVAIHRKRFDDDRVMYTEKEKDGTLGDYRYADDMIRLAKGDAQLDTYNHESIHKAIGQFLSDDEIKGLYSDAVKSAGGKASLVSKYAKQGYRPNWRVAAEEEIANRFIDFLKDGKTRGSLSLADKAAHYANVSGLPSGFVDILYKLADKIDNFFGKPDALKRLNEFYGKVEGGGFNGADRRTSEYDKRSIVGKVADSVEDFALDINADGSVRGSSNTSATPKEPARQPAMAAEVTPTADIGEISMKLTPEERAAEALGQVKSSKPKTAKEGELAVIGNVNKELADEIGLNTNDLDPEVAKAVTYLTQGKVGSDASEKTTKSIGRYLSDSIGYATRTLGEAGARTAESLIRGSKVKLDIKTELRPTMINVQKLSKNISGKTETARIQTGANIVKALEDRANVEKYISDPQTRELYDNIVSVFDNIKQRMIDAGMPVREDYSPWTMLKDYSEAPSYLANGLTDKKTRVVSGNAMERTLDEKPELTNNNILEVLPRYVDGMVNHIAFTPVLDDFADALETVPAYVRANTGQFNDGIKYLNTMLANGISQGSSSTADKWIKGLQNNIYSAFLWNNPKNAAFALTQKLLAAADITPEGRSVAKLFDEDDLKIVDKNIWFGEQTVSGDIAGGADPATRAGEMLRSSGAGELARKYDINRFSEQKSVQAPFRQAFAQGISQSKAYTEAIAAGKTPKEAVKTALKDPEAVAFAERTGNIQVNNTAFGANSLARPEFLRDSSAFKRAITMFMRFPLGVSNYIRDTAQIKDARALDVIQRGDPRATSIANMRGEYKAYLKGLKDVGAAVKDGKGGPDAPTTEVINAHIKLVEDNVKTIDKTIKGLSSLRGPKRVAALSAMWAATAAIQFAWDGMASTTSTALGNEKEAPTIGDSVASTDPTGFSLVNPWNQNSKVRGGLNSPLNPINKYGGVNTRTVLNAIPVVGSVNTLSRTLTGGNGISDFIDEKLKGE